MSDRICRVAVNIADDGTRSEATDGRLPGTYQIRVVVYTIHPARGQGRSAVEILRPDDSVLVEITSGTYGDLQVLVDELNRLAKRPTTAVPAPAATCGTCHGTRRVKCPAACSYAMDMLGLDRTKCLTAEPPSGADPTNCTIPCPDCASKGEEVPK